MCRGVLARFAHRAVEFHRCRALAEISQAWLGLDKLVVNPNRPDRVEPRVVKRRPKEYDRMTQPRAELRRRLLEGTVAA